MIVFVVSVHQTNGGVTMNVYNPKKVLSACVLCLTELYTSMRKKLLNRNKINYGRPSYRSHSMYYRHQGEQEKARRALQRSRHQGELN